MGYGIFSGKPLPIVLTECTTQHQRSKYARHFFLLKDTLKGLRSRIRQLGYIREHPAWEGRLKPPAGIRVQVGALILGACTSGRARFRAGWKSNHMCILPAQMRF